MKTRTGRPWTDKEVRLLGSMTDRQLAKKLGRSEHAVCVKRHELGVQPFYRRRYFRLPKRLEKQLGKMSDSQLAALAGCTRMHIYRLRRRLGITRKKRQ